MYLKGFLILKFNIFIQSDRAVMIDEIVEYVKFLRLQVKVKLFEIPLDMFISYLMVSHCKI